MWVGVVGWEVKGTAILKALWIEENVRSVMLCTFCILGNHSVHNNLLNLSNLSPSLYILTNYSCWQYATANRLYGFKNMGEMDF